LQALFADALRHIQTLWGMRLPAQSHLRALGRGEILMMMTALVVDHLAWAK
jgi:hypothetical protein